MPLAPRSPSMRGTPEERLGHPQGAARDSTQNFGPDHYAEPVTGDGNHAREYAVAHEGRPTIAQQKKRQGIA
jgi:hypothetical protein